MGFALLVGVRDCGCVPSPLAVAVAVLPGVGVAVLPGVGVAVLPGVGVAVAVGGGNTGPLFQ